MPSTVRLDGYYFNLEDGGTAPFLHVSCLFRFQCRDHLACWRHLRPAMKFSLKFSDVDYCSLLGSDSCFVDHTKTEDGQDLIRSHGQRTLTSTT